jgi:hypothetical protein
MMTNTAPTPVYDDVKTQPYSLADLAEAQNRKEV